MKTIEVVAAIICDGDKVFATQRGYGEFEGWWEFPGGKIELGESHHEALKREIREELGVDKAILKKLEEKNCIEKHGKTNAQFYTLPRRIMKWREKLLIILC